MPSLSTQDSAPYVATGLINVLQIFVLFTYFCSEYWMAPYTAPVTALVTGNFTLH